MAHIEFIPATLDDDTELRALLRRNIMEGDIAVSFRREPSYFYAAAVQGREVQVYKGVDTRSGALAGLGGRFVLPAYVNGERMDIGYLADLRVEADYRSGIGLRRGYDFLRRLHEMQPLPIYTTMILKGNKAALTTIAANRAGMPGYRPQGFVHTPMMTLGWPKKALHIQGVEISNAKAEDIAEIFAFINRQHQRRQFAPHYAASDLGTARLRDLKAEDFFVARRQGEIIGVLAAWDQYRFRQIHVERYRGQWRWLKPLYRIVSACSPLTPLPEPGKSLRCVYVALVAIADDDCAVFRVLLRALYRRYSGGVWHYLTCALHERDPLLPVLQEYWHIAAGGHLFTVDFGDTSLRLDERVPYIEAAAL